MDSFFQELEELYNKAPCGYHSLDSKGQFIRINDTELKMLGYSREEVLGRKFSDLITSESLSIFQQNFPIFKQRGWVNDLEFQFINLPKEDPRFTDGRFNIQPFLSTILQRALPEIDFIESTQSTFSQVLFLLVQ